MKTATGKIEPHDIEQALISPPAVFDAPSEVVAAPSLSQRQKIDILKRWELDSRALQRATEENMSGGEQSVLDEINAALSKLDPQGKAPDGFGKAPTKL